MKTDIMAIEVSFEIADSILWVRHYKAELERSEAAYDRVENYAAADGRTRQGKAYKRAKENFHKALADHRREGMRLAQLISEAEVSDADLNELIETSVLNTAR